MTEPAKALQSSRLPIEHDKSFERASMPWRETASRAPEEDIEGRAEPRPARNGGSGSLVIGISEFYLWNIVKDDRIRDEGRRRCSALAWLPLCLIIDSGIHRVARRSDYASTSKRV